MTGPVPLRAGPLAMSFDPATGWLRHARLGEVEVLRAIYPAVRDRYWNTLPNHLSNLTVNTTAAGFRVAFDADSRAEGIHFAFRGEITGTPDGAVTYRFNGEPRLPFLRNRIGLCVLHPIAECAGRPCDVEHPDGTTTTAVFPPDIAPHQPFHDVRALTHEVLPGLRAEVRCDGDTFETEDQRNWTDASFKTYPTPLALPRPVEVRPGDVIRQSVTLRLIGLVPQAEPIADPVAVIGEGGVRLARLPRIGLGWAGGPPLPFRPDYFRVEVVAGNPADLFDAAATGLPLEVAILLGDDPEAELARLAKAVGVLSAVRSWLVCRGPTGAADADDLALARRHLGPVTPDARFGLGTNLYFTEFNRARPPLGDAGFAGFSLNPQVHAFDDRSIVETLDGQSAVAQNAARLSGGRGVAVGPITLRPRFNPNGGPADPHDPRQDTPFAAAWTLAGVRRLAAGGAESLTYSDTATVGGPVGRVLADLAELSGWAVDCAVCTRPLVVEGLLFESGGRRTVLVANLTPEPAEVRTPLGPARLAPDEYRRIDG